MADAPNAPASTTAPADEPVTAEQQKALQRAVKNNLTRQIVMMLASCINCGMCADACHYYRSTGDPELIPINKADKLAQLLRTHFHPLRSRLPFLNPGGPVREHQLQALFKAAFEDCTLCGKCALTCPMGINTGEILYLARAMLCSIGRLPEGLVQTVESALTVGNYLGLATNDFVENVEWIGEELADELGEENFTIPIDKKGAKTLYIPHPLEVRDLPFLLMYAVQIMHAAGEDYTFSSYDFDTVNYAYYQGNPEKMTRIVQRVLDAAEKLDARKIVMAPCGHGYLAMRWESEKFFGRRHTLPVFTIVEQIDRFLQAGRIRLKKDLYKDIFP